MPRWNGGIIGPENVPTEFVASGMWSLEEAQVYIEQGLWPSGNVLVELTGVGASASIGEVSATATIADPYFDQTVLLLHGDGTNGAQNNTFLDSSANNFTITRNGNTTQGSFSPFSVAAGAWSNYFDGTGDYLTITSGLTNQFDPGGAFTFECWFYQASGTSNVIFEVRGSSNSFDVTNGILYKAWANSSGSVFFQFNTAGSATSISTTAPAYNTWVHFAVGYNGTTTRLWINGASAGTSTASYTKPTYSNVAVANNVSNLNAFPGYLSNVRFVKGSDVYGVSNTSITVPTTSLTAVSGTSLLTCQSNRFVDNSTNAFAITVAGNTSVQPFAPFNPSAEYSPETNGGSGYFDGSGDYLTVANNAAFAFGTGDFTVDGWIYILAAGDKGIFQQGTSYFPASTTNSVALGINNSGTTWQLYAKNTNTNSTATYTLGSWTHFAVVRSGTTTTLYLNGVSAITVTSDSTNYTGQYFGVGSIYGTGSNIMAYISNFRVVKGTAVYTSNFTPPTAPVTAISGTSLLANFTNAGIFDNTARNDLETVGNAQITTSEKKYGTGSISIPDTNASAKAVTGAILTGDFTIEFWVKSLVTGSEKFLVLQGINVTNGFLICPSRDAIRWRSNGTSDIAYAFPTANTEWYHVAIVRNGSATNNVTVYYNGTSVVSGTYTNQILPSAGALYIGPGAQLSASFAGTGYIDDFRITAGIARYTSNFTPPTEAFPNT